MELPVTESARYRVKKEIPVGTNYSPIKIGTIVTILSNTRGNNTIGDMAFNIYDGDRLENQVTPNNMKQYTTADYLEPITTTTPITTAGGRRRTRKHKRRHTKKRKQSRRRKN